MTTMMMDMNRWNDADQARVDRFHARMELAEKWTTPMGLTAPFRHEDGRLQFDVAESFKGMYEPQTDVMQATVDDRPDAAGVTVQLARWGCAAALWQLVEELGEQVFNVPNFFDGELDHPVDLVAQALRGFCTLSEYIGGTEDLLVQYGETVGALVAGGAPTHITSLFSMAPAWPVVLVASLQAGVRLTGWASAEYEARCWEYFEGLEAKHQALVAAEQMAAENALAAMQPVVEQRATAE